MFDTIRSSATRRFACRSCESILSVSVTRPIIVVALIWGVAVLQVPLVMQYGSYGMVVFGVLCVSLPFIIFHWIDRVILIDRLAFRCTRCGYDLRGLREPRCPECGTEFDPAERARILARVKSAPRLNERRGMLVFLIGAILWTVMMIYSTCNVRSQPLIPPLGAGRSATVVERPVRRQSLPW